jgi:hypothetical protein
VLRVGAFIVVLLAFVACESGTVGPTTTTSSTTTTIENDNCDRVAADTVSFLDSLIGELDDTRLAEFRDSADWPDDLRDLERAGRDLDIRVAALDCDPAAIQQRALDEANLVPGGPLSEGLLGVLLAPPDVTSTTSEVVDTTLESSTSTSATEPAESTTSTTGSETTSTGG